MIADLVRCMGVFPLAWLWLSAWLPVAGSAQSALPAALVDSTVTVEFRDTTVSPYDEFYTMAIYITTPGVPLSGLNVRLVADRPDLVELPDSAILYPIMNLSGSAIAGWDYKNENIIAPTVFNVAAISNLPGGVTPPPLAPSGTPYRIARFSMRRIAPQSVLDTLQDRAVTWFAALSNCSFSNPSGALIGIRDTSYCANPPVCDSIVHDNYDANTYLSGTVTIGPSCQGRGDVNASGNINSSDIIFLVNYVFKGGPLPTCAGVTGDVNCTGSINSSDIIYLVNFVFKGGPSPC